MKNKGWTLAQLTRRVGKGENTLHRWKNGDTSSYDLYTIIKLFKMANMSMDEAFMLDVDKEEMISESRAARMQEEIDELRYQLDLLSPVTSLVSALAITAADIQNGEYDDIDGFVSPARANRIETSKNGEKANNESQSTSQEDLQDTE